MSSIGSQTPQRKQFTSGWLYMAALAAFAIGVGGTALLKPGAPPPADCSTLTPELRNVITGVALAQCRADRVECASSPARAVDFLYGEGEYAGTKKPDPRTVHYPPYACWGQHATGGSISSKPCQLTKQIGSGGAIYTQGCATSPTCVIQPDGTAQGTSCKAPQ